MLLNKKSVQIPIVSSTATFKFAHVRVDALLLHTQAILFKFKYYTFKEKLQSPGTISFGAPGNEPAKICPKVN